MPHFGEDGVAIAVKRDELQELIDSVHVLANLNIAPAARRQGYAACTVTR